MDKVEDIINNTCLSNEDRIKIQEIINLKEQFKQCKNTIKQIEYERLIAFLLNKITLVLEEREQQFVKKEDLCRLIKECPTNTIQVIGYNRDIILDFGQETFIKP